MVDSMKISNDSNYRLGIDVGGTFTDFSLFEEHTETLINFKVPTTPNDPSEGIIDGIKGIIRKHGIDPNKIDYLGHGTTIATNAILELKGAKTALITTKGFRDILEIGRQKRPDLYDLYADKPPCLVPRYLRKEIEERILYDGTVLKEINEGEVEEVIEELEKENIESVAICFLYSFVRPDHEIYVKNRIQEKSNIYVSISSEVLPEFREYERMVTTVLNAYLGPKMSRYIESFKRKVSKINIPVIPYIIQSNGGIMSVDTASTFPVHTALSGPAAGVVGANVLAELSGVKNIITFDMGGTSTDVSLVENNLPLMSTDKNIGDYPTRIPVIDVQVIGAGGGSIASIDIGGALKVGPQSAGAVPGPACYGKGGILPTVTDANVVLGRLNPKFLLGGEMEIDAEASRKSMERISQQIGFNEVDAAKAIITVVNSNMARTIRKISIERGYNLREFTLVAFGGAGPLHASLLAKELNIPTILIPFEPGTLSSLGILLTDVRMDFVKTNIMIADRKNISLIENTFRYLIRQADEWLDSEGVSKGNRIINRSIDMRYEGQNYEIPIKIEKIDTDQIISDFYSGHKRFYGYFFEDIPVQLINFRVTAYGIVGKPRLRKHDVVKESSEDALVGRRKVFLGESDEFSLTPIYARSKLLAGNTIRGPAVIEQLSSTTLILPDQSGVVDEYLNIIVNQG
jgi:N-methylhydantoinase A